MMKNELEHQLEMKKEFILTTSGEMVRYTAFGQEKHLNHIKEKTLFGMY